MIQVTTNSCSQGAGISHEVSWVYDESRVRVIPAGKKQATSAISLPSGDPSPEPITTDDGDPESAVRFVTANCEHCMRKVNNHHPKCPKGI